MKRLMMTALMAMSGLAAADPYASYGSYGMSSGYSTAGMSSLSNPYASGQGMSGMAGSHSLSGAGSLNGGLPGSEALRAHASLSERAALAQHSGLAGASLPGAESGYGHADPYAGMTGMGLSDGAATRPIRLHNHLSHLGAHHYSLTGDD